MMSGSIASILLVSSLGGVPSDMVEWKLIPYERVEILGVRGTLLEYRFNGRLLGKPLREVTRIRWTGHPALNRAEEQLKELVAGGKREVAVANYEAALKGATSEAEKKVIRARLALLKDRNWDLFAKRRGTNSSRSVWRPYVYRSGQRGSVAVTTRTKTNSRTSQARGSQGASSGYGYEHNEIRTDGRGWYGPIVTNGASGKSVSGPTFVNGKIRLPRVTRSYGQYRVPVVGGAGPHLTAEAIRAQQGVPLFNSTYKKQQIPSRSVWSPSALRRKTVRGGFIGNSSPQRGRRTK